MTTRGLTPSEAVRIATRNVALDASIGGQLSKFERECEWLMHQYDLLDTQRSAPTRQPKGMRRGYRTQTVKRSLDMSLSGEEIHAAQLKHNNELLAKLGRQDYDDDN